ncbi:MAG: hypothetical protein PHE93_00390 [Clostridia bacterium]|nr:hypothetical protein [Clostridia bacterium]
MKKGLALILVVILVVASSALLLSACNKNETNYLDVYVNYDTVNEFSKMESVVAFPVGYSLYLSNSDYYHSSSDYGYQQSLDGFIITNGTSGSYALLNFIKSGDTTPLLGTFEIIQMQVRYGLIAVMTTGLSIGVYDPAKEEWVLPLVDAKVVSASLTASIELYCKIMSKDYIAVSPTADVYIKTISNGNTSYNTKMSIYSVEKKAMVGRVETSMKALTYLEGFDNYVVVTGDVSSINYKQVKIVKLNSDAVETPSLAIFEPTAKGIFTAFSTNDTDGIEATYFGNGKFLIHQETAGTESAYFYKEETEVENSYKYWQVYRWIYQADTDTRTIYESNVLMLSIVNEYYQYSSNKDFDAATFLNSGYSYVGYALYRNADKTVDYDQFIVDRDFNIVLSLSHNFGMNFETQTEVTSTSFYELVLTYAGDKGVVQIGTGIMRLYDRNGAAVCENSENEYTSATYNDGMTVCSILDTVNSTSSTKAYLYGAIDEKGEITVPFIYNKLTIFTGFYAIGERKIDNKTAVVLVGKNGYETQLGYNSVANTDYSLRFNSAGSAIYKTGCYAYFSGEGDDLLYGIKNTNISVNSNVICEPKFTQIILYSPLKGFGQVYAVVKENGKDYMEVYKLS